MSLKNYAITCAAVALLTAGLILFVPGLAETLETGLLVFLMTNAR